MPPENVLQLRVALTTGDYARLVDFYCAGLGIEPADVWTEGEGHGMLLEMGRASLELFDDSYAEYVDTIEVGERVSGPVRLALQVPDVAAALERLLEHGAILVRAPVLTPWGDLNARVQSPDGLQVILFQEPEKGDVPPSLIAALLAAGDAGDVEAFAEYLHPDVIVHAPAGLSTRGLSAEQESWRQARAAMPDLNHQVMDLFAGPTGEAARVVVTGTMSGSYGGFTAEARPFKVDQAVIARVTDGKIAELWEILDTAELARHLGEPKGLD